MFSEAKAQELFPHADPASNIPKGVLGIRIANEGFNEITQFRSQQNVKFMFGFTPKLMMTESFSLSNHHGFYFPSDFVKSDPGIGKYTTGVKKGNKYPYQFESLNVTLKYRFYSRDGEKEHFRMSTYVRLQTNLNFHS